MKKEKIMNDKMSCEEVYKDFSYQLEISQLRRC